MKNCLCKVQYAVRPMGRESCSGCRRAGERLRFGMTEVIDLRMQKAYSRQRRSRHLNLRKFLLLFCFGTCVDSV